MPIKRFHLILTLFFYFAASGFSQQVQEPEVQWVYEFSVSGMTSASDAEKIDTTLAKMVGIFSCKTDFETGKTVVICRPTIGFFGLRVLVDMAGFTADETYNLKEEKRVFTTKKPEEDK